MLTIDGSRVCMTKLAFFGAIFEDYEKSSTPEVNELFGYEYRINLYVVIPRGVEPRLPG